MLMLAFILIQELEKSKPVILRLKHSSVTSRTFLGEQGCHEEGEAVIESGEVSAFQVL